MSSCTSSAAEGRVEKRLLLPAANMRQRLRLRGQAKVGIARKRRL